jgi:hypothetical protein
MRPGMGVVKLDITQFEVLGLGETCKHLESLFFDVGHRLQHLKVCLIDSQYEVIKVLGWSLEISWRGSLPSDR